MRGFFLLLINYFDNVMTKLIVNNGTDVLKTDVKLFFLMTNCRIDPMQKWLPLYYSFARI